MGNTPSAPWTRKQKSQNVHASKLRTNKSTYMCIFCIPISFFLTHLHHKKVSCKRSYLMGQFHETWFLFFSLRILLTRRGMIPWGDWITGVWYPGETDSPGYDTPGSQIFLLKIWITQRILNQNRKYFYPLVSGTGRFELCKKLEVENLVGLSLRTIEIWRHSGAADELDKFLNASFSCFCVKP